jgi:DNA-binding NarL/FixJ family response regulator
MLDATTHGVLTADSRMTTTHPKAARGGRRPVTATPARVALVGQDELTTRGLASILSHQREHFELVSMVSRERAPIDIALYDHATSVPSGVSRLADLVCDDRVRKVAIYTASFYPPCAMDFIEQGACAYLSKTMTAAELVAALDTISSGQIVVPASVGDPYSLERRAAHNGEVLTPREAEVLALIAGGFSNTEIAQGLSLSVNSVKSYIRSCYRKIDVDSRTKAVLWAGRHGLGAAHASSAIAGFTRQERFAGTTPARELKRATLTGAASNPRGRGEGRAEAT